MMQSSLWKMLNATLAKASHHNDAAIIGARELIGPIIAITITLAAVYAPIGFQGGLTGSLFREFAFTLAGAVTISGIVALTLSPMMSAKLLTPGIEEHGFAAKSAHAFNRIKKIYARWLDVTLNARPAVYTVWGTITVLAFVMYAFSPAELAPTEDQGVIFGIVETSANATLDQTSHSAAQANEIFMNVPENEFTFQITQPTFGFSGMVTTPWDERDRTIFEILPELQQSLQTIPGVRIFPITPSALPGGGDFPIELIISSTAESKDILKFAQELQSKAAASGMFAFPPIIDIKVDQPQAKLNIDRNKVADLGLNLQQVGSDLAAMLGGNFVNRCSSIDGKSYKVIPQIKRSERLNPSQLKNLYISGPNNEMIPLSTIASIEETTVPRSLNRFQQL